MLALIPAVLALLLLAAHFFHAAQIALAALCLVLPGLLLIRKPWVPPALQAVLGLGSLEWLRTTVTLVLERQQLHAPFLRLALILGTVTLLTAASAWALRAARVRSHYRGAPR